MGRGYHSLPDQPVSSTTRKTESLLLELLSHMGTRHVLLMLGVECFVGFQFERHDATQNSHRSLRQATSQMKKNNRGRRAISSALTFYWVKKKDNNSIENSFVWRCTPGAYQVHTTTHQTTRTNEKGFCKIQIVGKRSRDILWYCTTRYETESDNLRGSATALHCRLMSFDR